MCNVNRDGSTKYIDDSITSAVIIRANNGLLRMAQQRAAYAPSRRGSRSPRFAVSIIREVGCFAQSFQTEA